MADPFSAASSAIGVISLGLQVAQQLVQFCQAYQSYDEDARRIERKAESLRRPLRALREIIEDAQLSDPDLAADLSEKALSLQSTVNRLEVALQRHLPDIADRFPEKIRGQLKRAIYPFRKDGLKEIFADLDAIQNALQTTLSIHSTQKMNRLGLMQEAILEEVQQIRITLQEYPEGMLPPSLLKSWCDSQSNVNSVTDIQITGTTNSTISDIDTLAIACSNDARAVAKPARTGKSFKYLSSFLRVAVTASFAMSKGAGGLSIAPCLKVQAIVAFDGSALDSMLTQLCASKLHSTIHFDRRVEICIRQVQQAFACGKAAPSDIYYYKYVPVDYSMVSFVDALVPFDMASSRDGFASLDKLTRFLVSCGSLPNNTFNQGALRGLLRYTRFREEQYSLACYLVAHGGPCVLDNALLNHTERYNIKYIFARGKELIVVPHVAKIIFEESEDELKAGLVNGVFDANDKACGCSLLQLAFGWPRGMQILIEAGSSARGSPLIKFWGCPSPLIEGDSEFNGFFHSSRLLLEAGCQLTVRDLQIAVSPKLLSLFTNELAKRRWTLWKLSQACLPHNELLQLDLREETVPDIQAPRLCAALAAQGRTVDPSLMVNKQYSSVYHHLTLYPTVMDQLFRVGFKQFDVPDSAGVTPVMRIYEGFTEQWDILARISWFVSKGADVGRQLPLSNGKVAHLIGAKTMRGLLEQLVLSTAEDIDTRWLRWESQIFQHKDLLFHSNIVDNCTCVCCPYGCTVFSVALRQALRWDRWHTLSGGSTWFRRLLRALLAWMPQSTQTSRFMIRLFTFDGLGLKHTCCTEIDRENTEAHEMRTRDDDEISEIQEENRAGVEILEILVFEFEAKFMELGLPLVEFLGGYWHTRMVQHLQERDPYNEEHDQGARKLGVILHMDEDALDSVSLLIGAQVKEIDDNDIDG